MPPIIAELERYDIVERYDADGGVISVPATGVDTTLTTVQTGPAPFFLEEVIVSVNDAGAIPLLAWSILVNGMPFYPYVLQRMPGGQFMFPVKVERVIQGYSAIAIVARVPTTSPAPFDVVGRIRGLFLRRR